MLSSGGVTSVETAAQFPVRIIESGPTAAVIAGQYYGKHFNISEMFCFDMGGTTAKSCLIQKGVAGVVPTFEVGRVQRFMKGSGLTIQVPVVDLMEIGAGGGSIAKVSKMGTLQVGPESSGADPGPICYGRGGTDPCVTDADLLLGYLDENYFLGGEMRLDKEAARRGVEERIARPLGVSYVQAIWGIHDLINETMAAAAKTHIAEKGGNPKIVTIAAFGGAGPVHAYGLAQGSWAHPACSSRRTRASARPSASSPPPGVRPPQEPQGLPDGGPFRGDRADLHGPGRGGRQHPQERRHRGIDPFREVPRHAFRGTGRGDERAHFRAGRSRRSRRRRFAACSMRSTRGSTEGPIPIRRWSSSISR